jgi:hypothetical protein
MTKCGNCERVGQKLTLVLPTVRVCKDYISCNKVRAQLDAKRYGIHVGKDIIIPDGEWTKTIPNEELVEG